MKNYMLLFHVGVDSTYWFRQVVGAVQVKFGIRLVQMYLLYHNAYLVRGQI
jgi:hypothetical protein